MQFESVSSNFDFSLELLSWYDIHGRHDLPWQVQDPYVVWLSEVMLQQTQVTTVIPYFNKFMRTYPTVDKLASAEWDEIASLWAGLGYYARARNLHKSAKFVSENGFPTDLAGWQSLSGIGQSTAGAIMSMGLGKYGVILDGNVKRVLTRCFAINGDITKSATNKQLWSLAESLTPTERNNHYTQAIMDLGATLCTRTKPKCTQCPMRQHCLAYQQGTPTAYPVKKKKTPLPTHHADVLILNYNKQYLWLQRPSEGLWGGLWCLPIVNNTAIKTKKDATTWDTVSSELIKAIDSSYLEELANIKHTFSHYHWMLSPKMLMLSNEEYDAIDTVLANNSITHQWLAITDTESYGLPKAMHKIINNIT